MPAQAIESSIRAVEERIQQSASRSGRDPAAVTLVAVTKTAGRKAIEMAYDCGLRNFGENRVQDALRKFDDTFPGDARLHMIGSLQSNKAGRVIDHFDLVHSVDRLSIATALANQSAKRGKVQDVLIEVNIAGEDQKAGVARDNIWELVESVIEHDALRLRGFMTMAPLTPEPESVRWVFSDLRKLREDASSRYPSVRFEVLSMGMTNDFEVAIEEGATHVRVGRAIFGG